VVITQKIKRPTRYDVLGVIRMSRGHGGPVHAKLLDSSVLFLSPGDTDQSEKTGSEQPYSGRNRYSGHVQSSIL